MLPAGPALGNLVAFHLMIGLATSIQNRKLDPAVWAGYSSPRLFGHFP